MGIQRNLVLVLGLTVLGCRGEDPPASSRVRIETERVEQVCRGTIVHAESELARIEAELALEPMTEQVEIHVIDPERIGEYCPDNKDVCVLQPPRAIYVSAEVYGRVLTRELIRDRLARSPVGSTKPMFSEGIAAALTRPMCAPLPGWSPPTSGQLLSKQLGTSLSEQELYLAGELLRWLLDTHGPEAVLDFMATLRRSDSSSKVRLAYLERFGSALELDLYAHWPAADPIPPERVGFVGVELPRDPARPRVHLQASLDCDDPRVRNDFVNPTRVFVEWILTIDQSTEGRYQLVEAPPEGVTLTLEAIQCQRASWTEYPPSSWYDHGLDPDDYNYLPPGTYRLRAYGPPGTSLDVELITP